MSNKQKRDAFLDGLLYSIAALMGILFAVGSVTAIVSYWIG